jgi:Uma2 family endonuclease
MRPAVSKEKKYTFRDYLTWPDSERWEIIDGVAYDMTPAPKVKHQRIVGLLDRKLADRIEEKGCSLFIAPTDVVLDEYNVVQPDVFIVCDKKKITDDNIQGAPDLIIEVASPGTELKDRREKKNAYENFGVKEYIIIFPEREYVERYCLKEARFGAPEIFNWDEILNLCFFETEINLREIFEKEKEHPGENHEQE